MIRVLNLTGDHRSIGRQHGEQVADLRPQIQTSIQSRLGELREQGSDLSHAIDEIKRTWEKHASNTLEMLLGISEALQLEWEAFFTYTISSYLTSRYKNNPFREGCTTWAANGSITQDKAPILAKNRDYHLDHQPLQCLARIKPDRGNPYITLTSAGSPGVFSSGINSVGLAIVDTHVSSTDIGPGIARYSLMMDILENFSHVHEAIKYLHTRPHFGDGTVTVVDAQGDMAVFEIAHSVQAVRQSTEGFIVSTNHFSAPETRRYWIDKEPVHLRGNSQERRRRIEEALRSSPGKVDIPWVQSVMSQHGDGLSAICRHYEIDSSAVTISSVIYLPKKAGMYVANGSPCQTPTEFFQINNRF
jgi:predicted choloylglycine hydrolase